MGWSKLIQTKVPAHAWALPVVLWAILLMGVPTAESDGNRLAGEEKELAGETPGDRDTPAPAKAGEVAGEEPSPDLEAPDLKEIVKGIQARYEMLRDFRGRFTQQSRLKAGTDPQTASGEVFFQKPGKMRWNYEFPDRQEIIINDGKLWQYVPQDRQVVVQGFDTSRVEYAFLTGLGNLEEQFGVEWASPRNRPDDSLSYLELIPRDEQASFTKVVLGVEPKGHRILATEVTDFFGNVTILRFADLQDNVKLADETFVFKAPKGVDVIDVTTGRQVP